MAKTGNPLRATCVMIQVLHEEGYNYRQIATRCGCHYMTTIIIFKRFQESDRLNDKPRSGQPCSTAREYRVLSRLCTTNRTKNAPELKRQWTEQSETQCTTRTIRWRHLKRGFKSCMARKKPLVTESVRRARPRCNGQTNPASCYIQIKLMSE